MATKGTVKEILEILRKDGWVQIKSNSGDHRQLKHPVKAGRVTVDGKLSKNVPPKIWNFMLRQAGLEK
jgi:predicted RNA binding protein YcfA (HicA-like mRNA interferase family)